LNYMLKTLFPSIDLGKLAVDGFSGFIAALALLFVIDALIPTQLMYTLFTVQDAASTVIAAFIIVVGSAILGVIVDSIFHTFGRWFACLFWRPLRYEFEYRKCLMEDTGLTEDDFEWVQILGTDRSDVIEQKYMRYTEVAGSSAYAFFLLSPATALFLHREYKQTMCVALVVAGVIALAATILIFTSAASLAKYEKNKTAYAMDNIRELTSHFCTEKKDEKKWSRWSFRLLWPLALLAVAMGLSCVVVYFVK
jgi:hypothetical protein